MGVAGGGAGELDPPAARGLVAGLTPGLLRACFASLLPVPGACEFVAGLEKIDASA